MDKEVQFSRSLRRQSQNITIKSDQTWDQIITQVSTVFGIHNVNIFNEAEDEIHSYHDLIHSRRLLVLDITTFTEALTTQEAAGFQIKVDHRGIIRRVKALFSTPDYRLTKKYDAGQCIDAMVQNWGTDMSTLIITYRLARITPYLPQDIRPTDDISNWDLYLLGILAILSDMFKTQGEHVAKTLEKYVCLRVAARMDLSEPVVLTVSDVRDAMENLLSVDPIVLEKAEKSKQQKEFVRRREEKKRAEEEAAASTDPGGG